MARKTMMWKTKGMNQDLSVSAYNPEFAFENLNLRLITNEGNTLMSWVNEKGTALIKLYDSDDENANEVQLSGTPIGTAVLNHYLILFVVDSTNQPEKGRIYKLWYRDDSKTSMVCTVLYEAINRKDHGGYLNFSTAHPLETMVSYESDRIQKVYWVDGENQPRVININNTYNNTDYTPNTFCPFDFVPVLQLGETVYVEKMLGTNGMFPAGVIQYAFTYFFKYGQETNIFYTSPLLYISHKNRGAAPDDKVDNSFKITINTPDTNFDYIRVYSIHRGSLNATAYCKVVKDIKLPKNATTITFIDNGFEGYDIEPESLLYKGGHEITASTMEQKDNTLFLGNIKTARPVIESTLKSSIKSEGENITVTLENAVRSIFLKADSVSGYKYANQLTAYSSSSSSKRSVPCGGFKSGETYKLGLQFQYYTGEWTNVVPLQKYTIPVNCFPSVVDNTTISLPTIKATLNPTIVSSLLNAKYKKVRPVILFPDMQDRNIVCQGVACPTMYTENNRTNLKYNYAQSSWFFRPHNTSVDSVLRVPVNAGTSGTSLLTYNEGITIGSAASLNDPRSVEIQGWFDSANKFHTSYDCCTIHTPEVVFDDQMFLLHYDGKSVKKRGYVTFNYTMSDIDIQTETPSISGAAAGFVHEAGTSLSAEGIVSGLFYEDFVVNDWEGTEENLANKFLPHNEENTPVKWLIYPWQKNGSLNNDLVRAAEDGVQTAKLKKKIISNLRYSTTTYTTEVVNSTHVLPNINIINGDTIYTFYSDQTEVIKMYDNALYHGNIDTLLTPDKLDGVYFAFAGSDFGSSAETPFSNTDWWKTWAVFDNEEKKYPADTCGAYKFSSSGWTIKVDRLGKYYIDVVMKKENVRMKYKSTPHLLFRPQTITDCKPSSNTGLAILEVWQNVTEEKRFEGNNIWLPCGEPVKLVSGNPVPVVYAYGDTYFQRWDCLKTYPFTQEDPNQIVEIGSFMLETRINIDGRYDRNRGQMNNLYMTPINFNLFNPIYSQKDNFFNYTVQEDDFYKDTNFPNMITWTKTKENGSNVDTWANLTLASVLDLDGDRGSITAIKRFNDQLIAFQDSGIAQILYNENTQISTVEGAPVEIANSGKVQGKRYLNNTVGCSNKWSIVQTLNGIYFMDSNDKSIYLFNGQLQNVSQNGGFNSWTKKNIPSQGVEWNPVDFNNFVGYFDKVNQDVFYIDKYKALAWNEKLSTFTSFYSYENTPYFCNLADTGIWIKAGELWKHRAGDYCKFFGVNKPYWMTLVGNQEPNTTKIFTNLEMRVSTEGDGSITSNKFNASIPFDYLETWNEYQHGKATLNTTTLKHHQTSNFSAGLLRKFRIWRCDIPRDNYPLDSTTGVDIDSERGIARYYQKPNDRMRNPWMYLKIMKSAAASGSSLPKTEIHDLIMTYFN